MASLITLVLVTLILFAAGAAGVRRLRPWPVAVRGGLAAMFILTGVSHFVGMREDLINMVPPALPEPAVLVGGGRAFRPARRDVPGERLRGC
jgi:hypothetical protein